MRTSKESTSFSVHPRIRSRLSPPAANDSGRLSHASSCRWDFVNVLKEKLFPSWNSLRLVMNCSGVAQVYLLSTCFSLADQNTLKECSIKQPHSTCQKSSSSLFSLPCVSTAVRSWPRSFCTVEMSLCQTLESVCFMFPWRAVCF